MNNSNICILSGRYPQSTFPSYVNHRVYADKHGYSYIYCNWPTRRKNPYENKLVYLLEYIDKYDYIFWIDDDAFFIDISKPLEPFLPKENEIASFCRSPDFKKIKTFLSSGQFFLKGGKEGRLFLEELLKLDMNEVKSWWYDDLGMFTKGDQDKIIYLIHQSDKYKGRIHLFEYHEFNSRFENLYTDNRHPVFVLHFTGALKRKQRHYRITMNKLRLNEFLLSGGVLADYQLQKSLLSKIKDRLGLG